MATNKHCKLCPALREVSNPKRSWKKAPQRCHCFGQYHHYDDIIPRKDWGKTLIYFDMLSPCSWSKDRGFGQKVEVTLQPLAPCFGDLRRQPNKQTSCGKMRRDWQQDYGEHVGNMWWMSKSIQYWKYWNLRHSGLPLDEFNGQLKKLKAMPKDEKPTFQFWTFVSTSFPLGKQPKICD